MTQQHIQTPNQFHILYCLCFLLLKSLTILNLQIKVLAGTSKWKAFNLERSNQKPMHSRRTWTNVTTCNSREDQLSIMISTEKVKAKGKAIQTWQTQWRFVLLSVYVTLSKTKLYAQFSKYFAYEFCLFYKLWMWIVIWNILNFNCCRFYSYLICWKH